MELGRSGRGAIPAKLEGQTDMAKAHRNWVLVQNHPDGSRSLYHDPTTHSIAFMGKSEVFAHGFVRRDGTGYLPGQIKSFFVREGCTDCHGTGCYNCDDLGYYAKHGKDERA